MTGLNSRVEVKIFITDLASYNEGRLVGRWVELPMDEDDLQSEIDSILQADHEEIFITDYESNVSISIGEYDNIFSLNEIIQEAENEDVQVLEALIYVSSDFKDALERSQQGNYIIYHDVNSCEDLGYLLVHEMGFLGDLENLSDELQRYIDYESIGRDMECMGVNIIRDMGLAIELY